MDLQCRVEEGSLSPDGSGGLGQVSPASSGHQPEQGQEGGHGGLNIEKNTSNRRRGQWGKLFREIEKAGRPAHAPNGVSVSHHSLECECAMAGVTQGWNVLGGGSRGGEVGKSLKARHL